MVAFIFTFDPRSGHVQVKNGQILKVKIFFKKTYLFCSVLSQDSKNVICFVVQQFEIPKIDFQKYDVITINRFLGHFTAKNKDIGLKVCTTVGNT